MRTNLKPFENPKSKIRDSKLKTRSRSEHHRLIQLAALRAPGPIHVGIIGVNEATFIATKNTIFWMGGAEMPAPNFRENTGDGQRAERRRHISHNEKPGAHGCSHNRSPPRMALAFFPGSTPGGKSLMSC